MKNDWIAAYEALKAVYVDDAYSNIAINEALAKYPKCSQGFVRTFVKGVIRDTIRLDYYASNLAEKGLKGIKKKTLIVIRMGIYAIRSLDSVPAHAACNEAVLLAKKVVKGQDRFINAILRNYIRRADDIELAELDMDSVSGDKLNKKQIQMISLLKSFNSEIVSLLNEQYGADETIRILDGLNSAPELVIRNNQLKGSREELLSELAEAGIDASAYENSVNAIVVSGGNVTAGKLFREGRFSIQSLSSILAIEAFAPEKGCRVLDMCAAPGGKTAAMAELMGDNGSITACDIHKHRCELIEATVRRLGISIVNTRQLDASMHYDELDGQFDYVLCDVPCSGLGVISTKPEIKLKDRADAEELAEIQSAILENAYAYVKDDGCIMYSTCTINKCENEGVTEAFIERHKEARIIENRAFMPYNNLIGFYYCLIKK